MTGGSPHINPPLGQSVSFYPITLLKVIAGDGEKLQFAYTHTVVVTIEVGEVKDDPIHRAGSGEHISRSRVPA